LQNSRSQNLNSKITTTKLAYGKNWQFEKSQPRFIEKYIIVLDKMYRCFILRCLNRTLRKEKENRERIKIAAGIADLLNILIHWNYNGTLLSPAQEILVTVTLEVASDGDFIDFLIENEVTAFGFDITIFASGV
jgi:hypothetical protein